METDPDTAARQAAFAWIKATGEVLNGLNHAFSNHLSLIRLVPELLKHDEVTAAELSQVAEDAVHLEDLLGLYRLYAFPSREAAEPILVPDVVPAALALLKHHLDLRDLPCVVEGTANLQPILMNRTSLAQALLLLLCAAGRHVRPDSDGAGIVLGYRGDGEFVEIAAETRGASAADAGNSGEQPFELLAIRWLIRDADGTAHVTHVTGGGVRVAMRVGSLARLRRRPAGA